MLRHLMERLISSQNESLLMAERNQNGNGNKPTADVFLAAIERFPFGLAMEKDKSIIYANSSFFRMTGDEPENVIGLPAKELKKRCKTRLQKAEIECSHYSVPIREQRIRVHIVRNVSARRELERQLLQSHKLEALGRLVGGVTHDFNNVLTAITIYTDLLADVAHGERAEHYLSEIRRSAERGSERIRQLLAFARQRPMQPRIVSVNRVLQGLEDTLRRMLGENVQLAICYSESVCNVRVDPAQFEEVVLNLAMNARDAICDRGKVTIETSVVKSSSGRSHLAGSENLVRIKIKDNGCGMDFATRSHLFEPFFTTKEPGKGTGLGLSTAYGIVSQSGGTISVDSKPGRGTTVTILLPRTSAKAKSTDIAKRKKILRRGSESLLVVEGDESVSASLKQLLSACGYQVDCAPDCETAVELARTRKIDALICDDTLAGKNGRGWMAQLTRVVPGTKILFSTSSGAFSRSNGNIFINKPFDLAELTQKLRQVLDSGAKS
jgi:two-component system, cell cycle sensor histidine kinase and response regulator CckA